MTAPWRSVFGEAFLRRLERLHLAGKQVTVRARGTARRARTVGDGLEFADHRLYTPGDDTRFIDWPYYARMERLLLRAFHEHSESEVAILLDVSASMGADAGGAAGGKFDYARSIAAAVAYVGMSGFERVVLVPFADGLAGEFRAPRSREHILRVLEFLSQLSPAGPTRLGEAVRRFADRFGRVASVVVISDLLDAAEDLSGALGRLTAGGYGVSVLHVHTPRDVSPDLSGPLLLEHAETPDRAVVDATEAVREAYRQSWETARRQHARTCVGRGALYVPVRTDEPFERLVLVTLRRAGVLT